MGEHQLVWFEVQSTIRLAAVTGGGERRVVLLDERGESHKLSRRKVLHTLSRRLPPPPTGQAVSDVRAELLGAAEPLDLEQLYARLEDGPRYSLAELAQVGVGRGDDAGIVRLVAGLLNGDGRVVDCLRLRKGGFERLDPESLARLREARAREAQERIEDDAFLAWFQPLRVNRPAAGPIEPPPEHTACLEQLVSYARAAEKSPHAKSGRRLSRRLDLDGADALLAELERVGVLKPHTNVLPYRHGVPVVFRAEARRAAAERVRVGPPALGVDLRHRPTIAIDDAFTRDVDDALSAWSEDGERRFAIHIAHVAHAVGQGKPLDAEGRRRGSSVYFADETIPMLPWELTEGYLGLEAGQDRPAVSLIGTIGEGDLPEALEFQVSHVRVDSRLDYEEEGSATAAEVKRLLNPMARALRERRREQGAVILDLPQVKMRIDASGSPRPVASTQTGLSHLLVSELMVLYNTELGRALAEAGLAAMFRVQPRPVKAPEADPADPLYPIASRRGLPPTTTAFQPGPHRTLGVEFYVQGTSPIRRYGDLIAQRQLLSLLDNQQPAHSADEVRDLRQDLERCERRARSLEDERERYWICRWLEAETAPLEAFVSRLDERRQLVYLPALRREFPCRIEHEPRTLGERVLVRPRVLEPKRLSFELA